MTKNKEWKKKSPEELQDFLNFRKRGYKVSPKKGKGAIYNRAKTKRDFEREG